MVRELIAGIISEAVGQTVKPNVREIAEAVAAHGGEEVTQAKLAAELGVHKSAISRSVREALADGYLDNREEKRGRPHRLVTGEPLPADEEVLPAVEVLRDACAPPRTAETPDENGDSEGVLRGCAVDGGVAPVNDGPELEEMRREFTEGWGR